MSFNEKLQKLRKENKYSQEELADKLDVTRQSVSKWESGITYPEMDKLLALCKIFDCSLEELTNDEVKEISGSKKNNITTLIDSGLNFINKTYHMFTNMKFNELLRCLFIMFVVAIVLGIFSIPIQALESGFYNMLDALNRPAFRDFFSALFNMIINVAYGVSWLLLFIYIFKIGFLDKYEFISEKIIVKDEKEKEPKVENKKVLNEEIKEVKEPIMVKSIKDHDYHIFNTLGTIALFFIKFFLVFFSIPFLALLFCTFIAFVINIYLITQGIFFVSIIFILAFGLILNILVIEFISNIIFNKKNQYKRMLITFIIGIAGLGIGSGIFLLEITNFKYNEEVPESIKLTKETYNYDFNDKLYFINYNYYSYIDIEYLVDNNLKDKVTLEIEYYKDYNNIYISNNNDYYSIYGSTMSINNFQNQVQLLIDALKRKELFYFDRLYGAHIVIYSSEDNIQKMKDNVTEHLQIEVEYQDTINSYEEQIYKLNNQIFTLEEAVAQGKLDKEDLEYKIEELQTEIQEYKNRIQDLLD